MKKHLKDIALIAAILVIGGVIALVLLLSRKTGAFVEVRVDGKLVASYPLSEDAEYTVEGVDGGVNHLIIRGGEAWVESASCPDGLCVNMGRIRYAGASVICLPNKVVFEIVGPDSGGVDVVVGQ
ncbi:MAG: NusG domain II-containing protein [Clostridia bacterium]|nr:NusG domain II-containing protein [Clostridia bacterium]